MKNLGFALILLFTLSGLNAQNNCLVLDMPFNGNSNDISGNNYHGKVINAKLTSDRFGNKNSAYFFDGNSAWIDIENPKKLNDISEQFTISAWFKPETGNYYNTIIAHGGAHFFLQLIDELNPAVLIQGVEFGYEGADSYFDRLVLSQTISESKWTHLVCTFNNSNQSVKIYLNGNLLY
ncbi:MAG: LamG-like jellyroll fold domain-containing protein, partial [Bacteroidia bacterium]